MVVSMDASLTTIVQFFITTTNQPSINQIYWSGMANKSDDVTIDEQMLNNAHQQTFCHT